MSDEGAKLDSRDLSSAEAEAWKELQLLEEQEGQRRKDYAKQWDILRSQWASAYRALRKHEAENAKCAGTEPAPTNIKNEN